MAICAFSASTPASSSRTCRCEVDKGRASEVLKVKQMREEMKTNPVLRKEVETEAEQKLEMREYAFSRMKHLELLGINAIGAISQQLAASKVFCAWREQAILELQQLRERERSSTEHLAQLTDAFLLAKEKMAEHRYLTDEDYGSTTASYLGETMDVLPITTPEAFALKHQHPPEHPSWIRSRAGKMAWSSTWPPGKRFSLRQTPQIPWRLEHYRWLKEGAGLTLVSDSRCDDRTPQKVPRPWAHLADLMWADRGAGTHVVVSNGKS